MSAYFWLKWAHVLSATLLFGTGLGSAFYKWMTDRSGDVRAIRVVNERVVLADWLFTTPTVILQPLTGIAMAHLAGFPLAEGWIGSAFLLYAVAGFCWLPVVWLQIRMRELSRQADDQGLSLPQEYWQLARWWFWLGVPAFSAMLMVYWLMIFKPT